MGRGSLDSKTFMDGIALSSFFVLVTAAPFFDRLKNSVYFLIAVDGGFASFAGLLLYVFFKFATTVPWDVAGICGISRFNPQGGHTLYSVCRRRNFCVHVVVNRAMEYFSFRSL
jgi:hypothetical protein